MTDKLFWTGPFGIRASMEVYRVPSRDGVNWVDRDEIETELRGGQPLMKKEIYLKKYGTLDENGHYWYIPPSTNICEGDGSRPNCCE